MGARRRVRQTAHKPLTREQLNYWGRQACRDSWEKIQGEQAKRRAEQEKRAAEFWMALLSGERVEMEDLEELEEAL